MKLLAALSFGLFLLLAGSEVDAQLPPTQCVTTVAASGTGDAIQLPQLPCWPTTTLIVMKTVAANLTNSPTITVTGSYPAPVVNFDLTPITVGEFQPNQYRLMSYNGANWIVMSQAESSIAGLVSVPNNSALKSLSTTTVSAVVRLGFYTAGDAPSLSYVAGGSACSLNSGAGDNGSQVQSANGKCWLASFPGGGVDVREWGVVASPSLVDSGTALQQAANWLGVNGGKLIFPAGIIYSTVGITSTLASAVTGAAIAGQGIGVSIYETAAGVNGITLNTTGTTSQVLSARDMTFATSSVPPASEASGLSFINVAGTFEAGFNTFSDVSNVEFRGVTPSQCWTNGFFTNNVSYINFINDSFIGCPFPTVTTTNSSSGATLFGAGANFGIVYNFTDCNFSYLEYGIYYGDHLQGVTISQTNFTPGWAGVYMPAGAIATDQLAINSSQFGYNFYGVAILSNFPHFLYSNNINGGPVGTIILATGILYGIISGNTFYDYGIYGSPVGSGEVAIDVPNNNTLLLNITGNTFQQYSNYSVVPIQLGSSSLIKVADNFTYGSSFIMPLVSGGTISDRITGNQETYGNVTGATNNGSGFVRLALTTSEPFVNGETVFISGVGGVYGIDTGIIAPISVIDGTHIDLQTVLFSGSYTGGGTVSWLP